MSSVIHAISVERSVQRLNVSQAKYFMKSQPFADLHRKCALTASSRFAAAKRQAAHAKASQWSVASLSVLMIIVSVAQALGLLKPHSDSRLALIQVGISTLVLVFSLLLALENYSVRSDRSHRCGLALNEVARRAAALESEAGSAEQYHELCRAYERVLEQYENHETLDYLMQKSRRRQNYSNAVAWIADVLDARVRYFLTFWPYLVLVWLAWIVFKTLN